MVSNINILDIIEIEVTGYPNTDYQSENAILQKNSILKIGTLEWDNIISLCENPETIFNNRWNAVDENTIANLTRSLILIKTHIFKVTDTTSTYEGINKRQLRLVFTHRENEYDLPITDPVFFKNYISNKDFLDGVKELFLCLSLGILLNGFHYKLVAGIIKGDKNCSSKVFSDFSSAEAAFNQYSNKFMLKILCTPQGWILLSTPKGTDINGSNVVDSIAANSISKPSTLTVAEAAMTQLGVAVVINLERFKKPGWFYIGETTVCCPNCNQMLEGFRMPYLSSGKTYHYWALVCSSCACAYEPNQLGKNVTALLYKSSTLRPVPNRE